MSRYHLPKKTLAGLDLSAYSLDELKALVRKILEDGLHGIAFSPYVDGQDNQTEVGIDQIRERMSILAPYVNWVRTFSCTRGNELSPKVAREQGLKSMVGVWLDDDFEHNEEEFQNGLSIVQAGEADILAIGNEVMLRDEMSEDQLIDYINRAKAEAGGIPVGYVDAYFVFENHPRIAEACDVILVNLYPFWEGYPCEHAILYAKEMYRRSKVAARGKQVIIAETGWPNKGQAEGGSVPGYDNAVKYFLDVCKWVEEENIDLFYFAGFDEEWKVAKEGDVGAYWGLWDKDGKLKYC